MSTRSVVVDGVLVRYTDEGEGPVLLMLHGWMHTLESFDALTGELAGQYRIIRIDLPGFGGSEMPPGAWRVEDYAALTAAFLKKIDVTPHALVGHSFGGRVIIKGVATGTLSGNRIVLIASAGNARRDTLRLKLYRAAAKVGKFFAGLLPTSWYRELRRALYRSAKSDYLDAGALAEIFVKTVEENLEQYAAQISVPTLLVWGTEDTTTPVTDGHRLAALIPGSTIRTVTGGTHVVHREFPRDVAAEIQDFL